MAPGLSHLRFDGAIHSADGVKEKKTLHIKTLTAATGKLSKFINL